MVTTLKRSAVPLPNGSDTVLAVLRRNSET
jgi:hypothetical protein